MPASTPELLAGAFSITVEMPPAADPEDRARVRDVLAAFLRAIDLGFFDDSSDRPAVRSDDAAWQEDGAQLRVRFAARDLPPRSFAILAGMFVGHAQHLGATVSTVRAQVEGAHGDLLAAEARAMTALGDLPFSSDIPPDGPAHKSLRIWLDFVRPVPEEHKDALIEIFTVWDALVIGPFPANGRPIGDSWAGPATTSLLLPTRLEHFMEDFESGPAAFDVLLRALLRVHARLPIESLEIE